MIAGHGRSGTNWLLEILNYSPLTICRNELNEYPGSSFEQLGSPYVAELPSTQLSAAWLAAASEARYHMGERDELFPRVEKHYFRRVPHVLGLNRLMMRRSLRRLLSTVYPAFGGSEWRIPGVLIHRDRLAAAQTILKINQAPGWITHLLNHHPNVGIVHIIRHPAGMLRSWRNRYLYTQDADAVRRDSIDRLLFVCRNDPAFAQSNRLSNFEEMSVEELELWFWRYSSEKVDQLGCNRPNYRRVIFGDLAAKPELHSAAIYQFCGLEYSSAVRARIAESSQRSVSIARRWQTEPHSTDYALIEKVLSGSPLKGIWSI